MQLNTKSYDLVKLINRLSSVLSCECKRGCQEWWVALPENTGTGRVYVFDFEDGLQATLLNIVAEQDWELTFNPSKASPFLMHFLVRGSLDLTLGGDGQTFVLKPLSTFFAAVPKGERQVMTIKSGEEVLHFVLHIDRAVYADHIDCFSTKVSTELAKVFGGEIATKTFQHHREYDLKGANLIHEVLTDEQIGLPRATFIEAKIMELFSLQLRRWEEEIDEPVVEIHLQAEDIALLTEAKEVLRQNLRDAPTIEELAKKVGLNRQKLKTGFKKIHGKTINEFLRNERLKLARQLLSNGRPVVKEVAAKVGYENASYFARRFREKYGLYPNEYLKALHQVQEEEA